MPKKPGPGIKVSKDGPYLVSGSVPLSTQTMVPDREGYPKRWQEGESFPQKQAYSLCRCGCSGNKPYCDSTHLKVRFHGKETASREPYMKRAGRIRGPALELYDNIRLCSSARFCERLGSVWNLTEDSGNPRSRKAAIQQACDCPSGRLVMHDRKTGKPIEPALPRSIGISQDPGAGVSGPIIVRGKVPVISSDGTQYELRNRMALCRCGRSKNKPFCDGTHIPARFSDKD